MAAGGKGNKERRRGKKGHFCTTGVRPLTGVARLSVIQFVIRYPNRYQSVYGFGALQESLSRQLLNVL